MMRALPFILAATLAACGTKDDDAAAPVCGDVATADFASDSGWNSAGYCGAPTDLGCFPWHGESQDTCGPFTTMRTVNTSQANADACATLLTALNCADYASEDDASQLSFYVESADRFTMRVVGSYLGSEVDTTLYFNPCHQNCQAAVTLETIAPGQQKICEIPSQGLPACLFPETAHSMTFVRADGGSIVIRMDGQETALSRVLDAP